MSVIEGADLSDSGGPIHCPYVIECVETGVDVVRWAIEHRPRVSALIDEHGAILFRGFRVGGARQFEAFADSVNDSDWVDYREAATPRSQVGTHVFTSTEYNPELRIYVHNENSHVTSWPLYIFFYCQRPADTGGETPIADCSAVYDALPRDLVGPFERNGWLYQRRFDRFSSITWQAALGVSSRAEVEDYCRTNFMAADWEGQSLTLRYKRWAALRHPRTGKMTWFNHGTFFSPHTLEPTVRTMLATLGRQPTYATSYGNGASVGTQTLDFLDGCYRDATTTFKWRPEDILMLDNMRFAHGRHAYLGKREVFVAMKERIHCSELADPSHYSDPPRRRARNVGKPPAPTCLPDL